MKAVVIDAVKVSAWLNELLSNYDTVNGIDMSASEDGVIITIETDSRNDVYNLGTEYLTDIVPTIVKENMETDSILLKTIVNE